MRLVGVEDQRGINVTKPKKPGGVTGKGFRPGKSGNPKGRPKGQSITALLRQLLNEPTPSGRQTRGEYLAKRLLKFACRGGKGDAAYAKELLNRVEGGVAEDQKLTVEVVFTQPKPNDHGDGPN